MMKLSNTLIMNENLLPSSKQAFTLAEVLITLSILGIVAALTIPSLVNRQSDAAAIVKLRKAISTYEQMAGVYMVENETNSLVNVIKTCNDAKAYFKVTKFAEIGSNEGCNFVTSDGAYWHFPVAGNPVVLDSAGQRPRFGVAMWAAGGEVNYSGTNQADANISYTPAAADIPNEPSYTDEPAPSNAAAPVHGFYNAVYFLNTSTDNLIKGTDKADNARAAMSSGTVIIAAQQGG